MKIWLDDERTPPDKTWTWVKTAYEAIDLLKKSKHVKEMSLDHDLGDKTLVGEGYDVLVWLEEEVFKKKRVPPDKIVVHSGNSAAAPRMRSAIFAIQKFAKPE